MRHQHIRAEGHSFNLLCDSLQSVADGVVQEYFDRAYSDLIRENDAALGRANRAKRTSVPRVFREFHKDMTDDAKAFRKEAKRRVAATIAAGGDPGASNRVLIIGYDKMLQEDD